MHAFLNAIAEGYMLAEGLALDHYTFVFPNSRSARYFRQCLSRLKFEKTRLKSMCITMAEMVEKGSGRMRASRERLLFMLYKAYCATFVAEGERELMTFDSFRFWGETILRDFEETDMYLAKPEELFRNVREYKEIQTFYLTDEQARIIRDYWGNDPYWRPLFGKKEGEELPFWNHVGADSMAERRFTQLWQQLRPMYESLRRQLDDAGMAYPGLAERLVAEKLLRGERLPFNPKRYVFVGFNRLTTAEHVIFEQLDRRGLAHFYWEYDPILMNENGGNRAGRFISGYMRSFTSSLPGMRLPEAPGFHRVDVVGVPSNVGQAKVAAGFLTEPETAVVLASDDLLLPMAHSIPSDTKVNITMGYPMRYSALAQFFTLLMSLQMRLRVSDGEAEFFHDDVAALLGSPLLLAPMAAECQAASQYLREARLFNLPARVAAEAEAFAPLRPLLKATGPDASMEEVADYVASAINFATEHNVVSSLDARCAEVILGELDEMLDLSAEFGVELLPRTFLKMIERTLLQRSIALEGRTFEATQVMGVLETRCLGFDNVVMLSMTDSVFPGRTTGRSFIPENLRIAYGLPTREHYDSDAAYFFYRILSNARHLTLLYDSRSGGMRSGEMSRFIFQLKYLGFPGVELHEHMASFAAASPHEQEPAVGSGAAVAKTPEVMERLNRYLDPRELHTRHLSASAIRQYLGCPMSFYLERVADIRIPDPETDDIGVGDIGNVFHETAERVYTELARRNGGIIDSAMLDALIAGDDDGLLDREIRRSVRLHIDKVPRTVDGQPNPELETARIRDRSLVQTEVFRHYLCQLFRAEDTPFRFIAAEEESTFRWHDMAPGLDVNFTMKIDRIDSLKGVTRLIDYKTGTDTLEFKDMASLTERFKADSPHAIFQLLTYCRAYSLLHPEADTARLRPRIFALRKLGADGKFSPILFNKAPLDSFAEVESEFVPELAGVIAEIFNPDKPFERAKDDKCCTFCKFYSLCHTGPRRGKF